MGYKLEKMALYDYSKNKMYLIDLPIDNLVMLQKFEATLEAISHFSLLKKGFMPSKYKCEKCIYNLFCDATVC